MSLPPALEGAVGSRGWGSRPPPPRLLSLRGVGRDAPPGEEDVMILNCIFICGDELPEAPSICLNLGEAGFAGPHWTAITGSRHVSEKQMFIELH